MQENIINSLIEWIHGNSCDSLKINDIAKKSGYSPWHLQRIFKLYKGITIGQYVTELKLKNAAKLLATTDTPIIEISFISGFASQQAFTRRFNQYFGETPAKFRRIMTSPIDNQLKKQYFLFKSKNC
ncbi:helix-turn-helix transcriptional regulator [Serratia marcescens]|uniref:helix-turn-helix transcriptional regulator n=1 Tax=unclassified Serratia (in: enterobacteria) TaxID=2647522 RepID=UPI0024AF0246|nr:MULTISPECIES: helix-turn-helix transcriptional regulator [unclassified Serratia (in: enterobacteria)]EMB6256474.1 helix-turn-helix transcriptional regulator [Serratia marcescens]MDI6974885.1 helix-turn-helix transcriptional regulator [Serratia sp. Se-RSBMAAmG]MDI9264133.1 helix-turn-helix transcriptional regulator [Serratia sp. PF2-63]MDI9269831.1 helix-turn-helix transcriptional regulator [Serratia sp. PF-27]